MSTLKSAIVMLLLGTSCAGCAWQLRKRVDDRWYAEHPPQYVDYRAKWNPKTHFYDCPKGLEAAGTWSTPTGNLAQVECVDHCKIFDCSGTDASRFPNPIHGNVIHDLKPKEKP